MWNASHIFNTIDGNIEIAKCADRRVAAEANTLDEDVNGVETLATFYSF